MGLRCLLLAVLPTLLAGCAAAPSAVGEGGVPRDFQLNVAVWRAERRVFDADEDDAARDEEPTPPGRYVLLVDGALHWSPDGDPRRGLPPRRRVLSRTQVEQLWATLGELGLDDPEAGTPPVSLRFVPPVGERLTVVAVVTGDERSWMFRRPADDPALAALAGRLSDLAWAAGADRAARPLRRYDFGPDPYARYRR